MSDQKPLWMMFGDSLFFLTTHVVVDGVVVSWKLAPDSMVMPVPSAWQSASENSLLVEL
jgi:hypothetical protein